MSSHVHRKRFKPQSHTFHNTCRKISVSATKPAFSLGEKEKKRKKVPCFVSMQQNSAGNVNGNAPRSGGLSPWWPEHVRKERKGFRWWISDLYMNWSLVTMEICMEPMERTCFCIQTAVSV